MLILVLIAMSVAIGFIFGIWYESSSHNKKRLKRDDRRNRIMESSDKRVDAKMRFALAHPEDALDFDINNLIVYND